MISSLPNLKILDDLPIEKIDRERANDIFTRHFEYLPYNRHNKESLVSMLQKREIRSNLSRTHASREKFSTSSRKSQYFYTRSLSAAKMGSSAWPNLHPLSITGSVLRDERRNFRPRQFEYHPSDSSLMVFGTLDGEVVVINHESEKIVSYIPSLGAMNSVLGLCWLKKYPSKVRNLYFRDVIYYWQRCYLKKLNAILSCFYTEATIFVYHSAGIFNNLNAVICINILLLLVFTHVLDCQDG